MLNRVLKDFTAMKTVKRTLPPWSHLLVSSWFVAICGIVPADSALAIDDPNSSCERALGALSAQAKEKQEIAIQEVEHVDAAANGVSRRKIELRWTAFGREFVVDLVEPPKTDGETGSDSTQRQLFSGEWRGNETELVLFRRWPSDAWEGDIKKARELYSIRVRCDQKTDGTTKRKATIFFLEYPAEPEA